MGEADNSIKINLVEPLVLPTTMGTDTKLFVFKKDMYNYTAIVKGDVIGKDGVLVRLHSECLFGDVLGSKRCDCGEQLELAKKQLKETERGILFYLPHEGRGIGLRHKVEAYRLKEKGYDTADANRQLGFAEDLRDYSYVAHILENFFELKSVTLLTNNPDKIKALEGTDISVTTKPLKVEPNEFNKKYFETKKKKFGHNL